MESKYVLENTNGRTQLRDLNDLKRGALYVDFSKGSNHYRRKFGGGKSQPIAKAVGLKGAKSLFVVDATAGLGSDAFVLASLGCKVHMIERSQEIAALLVDGLKRAKLDSEIGNWVNERLSFECGDSLQCLDSLEAQPDVVYLDPMYPKGRKAALGKMKIQVLQDLVGEDMDSSKLLEIALKVATKRVVVKRPLNSDSLTGISPTGEIKMVKNRFDLYIK